VLLLGIGYIGSALFRHLKAAGYSVDTVDLEWFGNPVNPANRRQDFAALEKGFVRQYDVVVLTAAHSSVPMCEGDRLGAYRNNVDNFVGLIGKMGSHQKFIYAGSSCVYVDSKDRPAVETDLLRPVDMLSFTKTTIDQFVQLTSAEFYGLRLGSVNGAAPSFRADLMINAMTIAALQGNTLTASNRHCHRPILGMADLCRAVEAIAACDQDRRGIYNVASFNAAIGDIAQAVADAMNAVVLHGPDSQTYDFCINTSKFCQTFGFEFRESVPSIVEGIIRDRHSMKTQVRKLSEPYVCADKK
jgi:nucleoside-diphosphate-sugar epimerase